MTCRCTYYIYIDGFGAAHHGIIFPEFRDSDSFLLLFFNYRKMIITFLHAQTITDVLNRAHS